MDISSIGGTGDETACLLVHSCFSFFFVKYEATIMLNGFQLIILELETLESLHFDSMFI